MQLDLVKVERSPVMKSSLKSLSQGFVDRFGYIKGVPKRFLTCRYPDLSVDDLSWYINILRERNGVSPESYQLPKAPVRINMNNIFITPIKIKLWL